MGRCILKTDRDRDEYVEWSSVVDDIVAGPDDRAEMGCYLLETGLYWPEDADDVLARADERGTSDRVFRFGGWEDEELPVGGDRWLPRAELHTYAHACNVHDNGRSAEAMLRRYQDR